jgi:Mlc titration factor MtfA (ptsG expression regulator)
MGWWQRWKDWREQRVRATTSPCPCGPRCCRYPFLQSLSPTEERGPAHPRQRLSGTQGVLGAQGLVVTDEMAVAIAAQACLPILHLDLALYDGFVGIVVHPDEVVAAAM